MVSAFRELIISRRELVYVLNALQVKNIVGVNLEELELPSSEFEALLREAEEELIASELLTIDPESHNRELEPTLVGMIGALAFRHTAFVLVRGVHEKGQQLFIFNVYQDVIVEHTQPQEDLHRLFLIESMEDLFERLDQLIPLHTVIVENRPTFVMEMAEFEEMQQRIEELEDSVIRQMLVQADLEPGLTSPFIQALRNPLFTFSLAFLHCENSTATAASSAAIFADQNSAWGVWGGVEGINDEDCLIFPTGINDIKSALVDWLDVEIE
jgi:hypothetical protein